MKIEKTYFFKTDMKLKQDVKQEYLKRKTKNEFWGRILSSPELMNNPLLSQQQVLI